MVQPDGRRSFPEWRDSESQTRIRAAHAVDLQNVSVHHPGRSVLQHIDFYVREGDIWGIIGPEGGGKGTLLETIAGFISPTRGMVQVYGSQPCARLRRRLPVGYVSPYAPFSPIVPATVYDAVLMGAWGMGSWLPWSRKEHHLQTRYLLSMIRLDQLKDCPVNRLSPGRQQLIRIARALVNRPPLLLLDDPFRMMDAAGRSSVYELLNDLKAQYHLTAILTATEGEWLQPVCDRMACLNGTLLWQTPISQVSPDALKDPCNHHPVRKRNGLHHSRKERLTDLPPAPKNPPNSRRTMQFWR
ncbi:MAG: metal ABC transporter ATP-binding protein [bacterium]